MNPLPYILSIFTGRRDKVVLGVDFEWSNSVVHNIFRVYELIFWRKYGIRPGLSGSIGIDNRVIYQFHSFESVCAYIEQLCKNFFAFKPVRIWIPKLSPVGGLPMPGSPYLFAIAVDTQASSTAGADTGKTLSFTITGSNTLLIVHQTTNGGTGTTGVTRNGSAMTIVNSERTGTVELGKVSQWCFVGSTGTSNIVSSCASAFNCFCATSYTGVNQSTTPDSSNWGQTAGAVVNATLTTSTTVVASNCWTFLTVYSNNQQPTAGTGSTSRQVGANILICAFDSNGTVGTGSVSMTVQETGAATQFTAIISSFAPPAVATSTVHFLGLLGIGS